MTLLLSLLSLLALAQQPCTDELSVPNDRLSVAWISAKHGQPLTGGLLKVVPTSDLRRWIKEEDKPTVGRLLQATGLRKKNKTPRRAWNVAIFEVSKDQLCRPIADAQQGSTASGLATCPKRQARTTRRYPGCGLAVDWHTEKPSFQVYGVRWKEAAKRGHCLLPAKRFVNEGSR